MFQVDRTYTMEKIHGALMTWESITQRKRKLKVSVTKCSLHIITALQCMIIFATERNIGYAEKGQQ